MSSALDRLRKAKADKSKKSTPSKKPNLKVVPKSSPKAAPKKAVKKSTPVAKTKTEKKAAPKKAAVKVPAKKGTPVPSVKDLKKMSEPNLNVLHDLLPGEIDGWGKMKLEAKRKAMIDGFHGEPEDGEHDEQDDAGTEDEEVQAKAPGKNKKKASSDDDGAEDDEEDSEDTEEDAEEEDTDGEEVTDEVDAELDDEEGEEASDAGTSKKTKAKETPKRRKFDANDLIDKTVKELTNLSETEADEEFSKVSAEIENSYTYFRLGGVLSVIKAGNFIGDHESFRKKVEAEFDMGYRKADYLIEIYENIVASGVKWKQIQSIGWSKMKEISHLITPENVEEWVEKVQTMNRDTLIKEVKLLNAEDGEELSSKLSKMGKAESTVSTMSFKVHNDQKETISEALTKAKEDLGTEAATVALEGICLDYLSGSKKVKTRDMTVKQFFQKLVSEATGKNEDLKIESAIKTLLEGEEFEQVFGLSIKDIDFTE